MFKKVHILNPTTKNVKKQARDIILKSG